MRHTPTPWAYDENRDAILVNENKEITKLLLIGVRQPVGNHPSIDEAKDNARHIVHCVNSHAALLEALKGIVKWSQSDCRYDHHGYCQEHFMTNPCEIEVAKQAIAQAEPIKEITS